MKILIFGASGLIGQALVPVLKKQATVAVVGRNKKKLEKLFKSDHRCFTWPEVNGELLAHYQLVINLTGENISSRRWSRKQKTQILDSRVKTTQKIAELCAKLGHQSPRIINASAVGIYGTDSSAQQQNSTCCTENSPLPSPPNDFLSEVGQKWEAALQPALEAAVPTVIVRFGVVLSKQGGMLKELLPSFKFGLGAILGDGSQIIPWVSMNDLVSAIQFIIDRPDQNGVFNIVAPQLISQKEFAQTLAQSLHRPCLLRLPKCVVNALFGAMGKELLLSGQRIQSTRLADLDFIFQDKTLTTYLNKLEGEQKSR